jgi:hypothetical protein
MNNNDAMIQKLGMAIASMNEALKSELDKKAFATSYQELIESTPADISARYWLQQVLDPLSRAELKSIVNGFLVQLLNDEQAKMLVKFIIARYPQYFTKSPESQPEPQPKPAIEVPIDVTKVEVKK